MLTVTSKDIHVCFGYKFIVSSKPTCATIKKDKMRKNLVRQFTPKERVDRVQQERLIKQDNLYYHSASEIKFDW